jgi:hypothetical protein
MRVLCQRSAGPANQRHTAKRTHLGNFGGVGLHVLLQLLNLAPRGGVDRVARLDGLPSKQAAHHEVVRLARLHRRRLGDAAAAHAHLRRGCVCAVRGRGERHAGDGATSQVASRQRTHSPWCLPLLWCYGGQGDNHSGVWRRCQLRHPSRSPSLWAPVCDLLASSAQKTGH